VSPQLCFDVRKVALSDILAPEFWRRFLVSGHVLDEPFTRETLRRAESTDVSAMQNLAASVTTEGWGHASAPCTGFELEVLTTCAEVLHMHCWHPVWLIVLDEFWLLAHAV